MSSRIEDTLDERAMHVIEETERLAAKASTPESGARMLAEAALMRVSILWDNSRLYPRPKKEEL